MKSGNEDVVYMMIGNEDVVYMMIGNEDVLYVISSGQNKKDCRPITGSILCCSLISNIATLFSLHYHNSQNKCCTDGNIRNLHSSSCYPFHFNF